MKQKYYTAKDGKEHIHIMIQNMCWLKRPKLTNKVQVAFDKN